MRRKLPGPLDTITVAVGYLYKLFARITASRAYSIEPAVGTTRYSRGVTVDITASVPAVCKPARPTMTQYAPVRHSVGVEGGALRHSLVDYSGGGMISWNILRFPGALPIANRSQTTTVSCSR